MENFQEFQILSRENFDSKRDNCIYVSVCISSYILTNGSIGISDLTTPKIALSLPAKKINKTNKKDIQ